MEEPLETDDFECWKDDPDKEVYYDYYHDTMCSDQERLVDTYKKD